MGMKVTGIIGRVTGERGDWSARIFTPLGDSVKEMEKHPTYQTISIAGNLPMMKEGKEYVLEVEKNLNPRYKGSYNLVNIIGYEEEMEGDNAHGFISQITSDTIATAILNKYPKFIQMCLEDKEIDYSDIYNVGDTRFKQIKDKINTQFKFFNIVLRYPEYRISLKNARKIAESYGDISKIYKVFDETPYYALMEELGYGFEKADKCILKRDNSWEDSFDRLENCMVYNLKMNEYEGNSFANANDLYVAVREYIPDCSTRIKQCAIDSDLLHYEEDTKNISIQSTYNAELQVAWMVSDMVKNSEPLDMEVENFLTTETGTLTDEQSQMLYNAKDHKISIVDAPAGSGKSFSTNALCNMLDYYGYSYLLLSPSGAGAKRLSEATFRKAMTIHKAVGYGAQETKIITQDYVLVDEFGMTDLKVFYMLLQSIEPHTRLVLVGNIDQLASVGLGNCMHDMIKSGKVPTARFNKVHRFGVGGIATASTKAMLGEEFLNDSEITTLGQDKSFKFQQVSNDNELAQMAVETYDKLLKKGISIDDIMMISPFNVGAVGSITLSNKIQNIFNPNNTSKLEWSTEKNGITVKFRVGDRVLNTKNSYDALDYDTWKESKELGIAPRGSNIIYNGMDGIIRSLDNEIMVIQFDEDLIVFTKEDLSRLLLRYVISCHRSQGQERKYILGVVSPRHECLLTSNLLYVLISRAKVKCYMLGDKHTIDNAIKIKENLERKTQLTEFILKEFE
ncbi:MAG: AAA family ATPase [Bacteroidales bacterium]|uniref:AAA family ATPase n=1 Tax=Clostridium sp. TaxID=1506 RepID=UPI003EE60E61